MQVSEIFTSIQGEGIFTGEPTVFVRLQGCSIGCTWCDSKYTWPTSSKNTTWSLLEVKEEVARIGLGIDYMCITGGEPLEQLEAVESLVSCFSGQYIIEVETSGEVSLPEGFVFDKVKSWVVDVKGPSAKLPKPRKISDLTQDLCRLRPSDQIKGMLETIDDLEYFQWILSMIWSQGSILPMVWLVAENSAPVSVRRGNS